jgi:c-di-AMP phosphodiesterase-like protein
VLIERIFGNPKTTILGLIIIGLCFVLVFYEKASRLTEVSAFMMGAFALLFLKDPKMAKQQAISQRISKSKKRGKHSKSASANKASKNYSKPYKSQGR